MVTLLNVDVPLVAVTLPSIAPTNLVLAVIVVPVTAAGVVPPTTPSTVPVTLPVRFPASLILAVITVPVIAAGVFAPITPSILPPDIVTVEPKFAVELAANVVKEPVFALAAPIGVPSIAPPFISTLAIVTAPVPLGVRFRSPLVSKVTIVLPSKCKLSILK